MPDYQAMYYLLCKAVDEAIDPLTQIPAAQEVAQALQEALLQAEEVYISTAE